MTWKIQLSELNYDHSERNAVNRVVSGEWLTMGGKCGEFETEFSRHHDFDHPGVFVSSATAGLHLILMALQITEGDEVIVPALTFVSDANVVLQLGATPVFADSTSLEDFNLSTDDVIDKITDKTRAIVIVHFAGFPMDLERLKKVCEAKGVWLIEDCAHAPGASIGSKYCGTFGDFGFFSFFSNKNLAVGEGGMVFAKDQDKLDMVRSMRSHGMSSVTLDRHLGRSSTYDVQNIGLNYRPDEIRATLGIEQLKKLKEGNVKRGRLFDRYKENFTDSLVKVPFANIEADVLPAYHIMPIILPKLCDRNMVMDKMKNVGIQTSIHYPSFSSFSAYKKLVSFNGINIAQDICARELTLPLHPRLKFGELDIVSNVLLEAVN